MLVAGYVMNDSEQNREVKIAFTESLAETSFDEIQDVIVQTFKGEIGCSGFGEEMAAGINANVTDCPAAVREIFSQKSRKASIAATDIQDFPIWARVPASVDRREQTDPAGPGRLPARSELIREICVKAAIDGVERLHGIVVQIRPTPFSFGDCVVPVSHA